MDITNSFLTNDEIYNVRHRSTDGYKKRKLDMLKIGTLIRAHFLSRIIQPVDPARRFQTQDVQVMLSRFGHPTWSQRFRLVRMCASV